MINNNSSYEYDASNELKETFFKVSEEAFFHLMINYTQK